MNKISWIIGILIILVLLIGVTFLFNSEKENSSSTTSNENNGDNTGGNEYKDIQTSDDAFSAIDDAVNYLD